MNRLTSTATKTAFGQTLPLPVMSTIINQAALPRRNMTTNAVPPTNPIINTFYQNNMTPHPLPRTNISSTILSQRTMAINAAPRTSTIMTTLLQKRTTTNTLPHPSNTTKTLPRTNPATKMVQQRLEPIHADFQYSKRLSSGDCDVFIAVFLFFVLLQVIDLMLGVYKYSLEQSYKRSGAEKTKRRSNGGSTDNKPESNMSSTDKEPQGKPTTPNQDPEPQDEPTTIETNPVDIVHF